MALLQHYEPLNEPGPANGEISEQRRELATQLGAISWRIEQNIQDLTQPMTVIMGLNDLILPQIEPGSELAADLIGLTKQVKRLNQIVNEVNNLVEQRKSLLKIIGNLYLNSARLEERASSSHARREE